MMKKVFFAATLLATTLLAIACTSKERWSDKEREALRNEIGAYRDMVYLDNLGNAEFIEFSDGVVEAIEIDYPIYTTFIELPARGDTVEVYVVSTIVNELDTDAHNMRNIYPYPMLVAEGILPPNLSLQAQRAFYNCFASKVNRTYPSTRAFFNAIMADTLPTSQITQLQRGCASELFDWEIEIDQTLFFD